jgi:demethylmenaquinone methyltransferase/2-methoxy-6-polyprenyl-1,4-benzoquinol methylase
MSKRINNLFTGIANRYDIMNHLLSLGVDTLWRKQAAAETMIDGKNLLMLDVGTGTGDLAIEISRTAIRHGKRVGIEAIDFNADMLIIARRKITGKGVSGINLKKMDALSLDYPAGKFDVVTSGFVMRNLDDLNRFAREAYRVTKHGGKAVILDMARPESAAGRAAFRVYFPIMRLVGDAVDRNAYEWLVYSIRHFDRNRTKRALQAAGFKKVRMINLLSGVAYIAEGEKP